MKEFKYISDHLISVIVSTFNRPKSLNIVLRSLCIQNDNNYEIIIADDGSNFETRELITEIRNQYKKIKIKHIWQEKKGFRLSKIRNKAFKKSSGEYIIFLDGDCIPPPDFIKKHRELSEVGFAVYGQRILSTQSYTYAIEKSPAIVLEKDFWSFLNIADKFIKGKINRLAPIVKVPGQWWRKVLTPNKWNNIRGCNWSMWKTDYENINGSDESFEGWGSEDKDVAVRLLNIGVKLKDGRNYSYVIHLWHTPSSREQSRKNLEIVKSRLINKTILPNKGLK